MSTESAAGAGGLSGFMKSRMKSVAVAAALIAGTWFWIALPIEGMTPEGNRIFGALIAWVILLTAEVTDASIITLLWLVFLIIAGLAKGLELEVAVEQAKKYISEALSAMLDLGAGSGPMDHAYWV